MSDLLFHNHDQDDGRSGFLLKQEGNSNLDLGSSGNINLSSQQHSLDGLSLPISPHYSMQDNLTSNDLAKLHLNDPLAKHYLSDSLANELSPNTNDNGLHNPVDSIDSNQLNYNSLDSNYNSLDSNYNPLNSTTHDYPSCSYCSISCTKSLVKCDICQRWFCNASTGTSGSHIVTHLVHARHNQVSLHGDSDLGATALECYNCGSRNVFILGFVSAKQDSVVVILCRIPCAQKKDATWDTSHWQPIIDNRLFLPWVAEIPSEEDLISAREVQNLLIVKLESQWRMNLKATIDDITEIEDEETEILPILMRYNDAIDYQKSFAPLVDIEAKHDKMLKDAASLELITVEWYQEDNKHFVQTSLSNVEACNLKVTVGDRFILRYSGVAHEPWTCLAFVIKLPTLLSKVYTLELEGPIDEDASSELNLTVNNLIDNPPPTHIKSGFTAQFVWKGTSYDRMQIALKKFALSLKLTSSYIYHKLLGHEVAPVEFDLKFPKRLSHPAIGELNPSQVNAVRSALVQPLTLIQGPPGTGKTVTSATIIYHLLRVSNHQILVCAPLNVAVDHLTQKLLDAGISVVRMAARSREDSESILDDKLYLHNMVTDQHTTQLKRLMTLRQNRELTKKENNLYLKKLHALQFKILSKCKVVCTTCAGAGDYRIAKRTFRTVLIDESTHAYEPESLIPIVKGAKQVILVGDHQQLGPTILDKRAGNAGLQQSLFERLITLGHVPIRLEVQYRMHPALSEFPSNMFYEGTLQNGVTSDQRVAKNSTFPWPVENQPMMFWGNYGREEISASGHSYLNRVEAMNAERVVSRLFRDGVDPSDIAVITPYEGQRSYIAQYMLLNCLIPELKDSYMNVEITSVDAFQGREKNYIILSCVRANDSQIIGFLSDPRRLNVALTRAKYGLVVLGNPRALCKNRLWVYLLAHFREKGCLVDGPLDALQLSMVPLGKAYNSLADGINKAMANKKSQPEFDTASVVSQLPQTQLDEVQWPLLDERNEYNKGTLSANFVSKLDDIEGYKPTPIDDEIKALTRGFSLALEF